VPSAAQCQVASQAIEATADGYAQNRQGYREEFGAGSGIASIISAYMPQIIELAQGQGSHGNLGYGVQSDGIGLGVNKDVLSLAMQAVGTETENFAIVAQGWANALPNYLAQRILPNGGEPSVNDITAFLLDPSGSQQATPGESPAADALRDANQALDFLEDNAVFTWTKAQRETYEQAIVDNVLSTAVDETVGMVAEKAPLIGWGWTLGKIAYGVYGDTHPQPDPNQMAQSADTATTDQQTYDSVLIWIQTLAHLGYLTPQTIRSFDVSGRGVPVASPIASDGTPLLVPDPAGGYMLNPAEPEAVHQWLSKTQFGLQGSDAALGTGVGNPANPKTWSNPGGTNQTGAVK